MSNDPKHVVNSLPDSSNMPSRKERQQRQSNLKKPTPPTHMAEFQNTTNLPSSGPTPPSSPAAAAAAADDKASAPDDGDGDRTLDDNNKPAIEPIRIALDLRSGQGRASTVISGVSPLMTDFLLRLMTLRLGCPGVNYGAKGVKLYGNHCQQVKTILTTKLGVPGAMITMHKVKT